MSALSSEAQIAIIGAGTMGAGIAQVAAAAGHPVVLFDVVEGAAQRGIESISTGLAGLVSKGKKTQTEVDELVARISPAQSLDSVKDSALVIEVIIEDLAIKRKVLADIEALCSADTIIASNTSSISISALAAKLQRPEKVVGMHFFNPAAILKLVEVVSGLQTDPGVAATIYDTALAWGKKPVHAKSTPGFIVNRVARSFYAEALRSVTEQVASVATIDTLMRSCGSFKMGPLQLVDLIGQDVNCAVSQSVYAAYFQDKRFLPSVLQAEMVVAGLLGKKSGRGFYDYSQATPEAEIAAKADPVSKVKVVGKLYCADALLELVKHSELELEYIEDGLPRIEVGEAVLQLTDGRTASQRAAEQCTSNLVLFDYALDYAACSHIGISAAVQASDQALRDATGFFQSLGKHVCLLKDVPGIQVMRTVCMLINEAYDAVNQGVCDFAAVDIAMQAGVAYPRGPIAWSQEIGLQAVVQVLQNLQYAYGEERYRTSPLLLTEIHRND